MKLHFNSSILVFFIALNLVTNSAIAETNGSSLSCKTLTKGEYDMSLRIEVKNYSTIENHLTHDANLPPHDAGIEILGSMTDITVSATFTDYDGNLKTETGRRAYEQNDRSYKPNKYKNTLRFNFDQLTNTETFADFSPGDSCSINFMLPKDAEKLGIFKAFAVVNCDQSGGSQTLSCTLTKN